jgi:hypothetical protein
MVTRTGRSPAGGLEDGIGDRSRRAGDPDFAGAFGARWPEVGAGQTPPVAGPTPANR